MPEPQVSAPVEGNKDKTNFTNAGVGSRILPSRFDQTDNTGSVKSSSSKMNNLNANSKNRSY